MKTAWCGAILVGTALLAFAKVPGPTPAIQPGANDTDEAVETFVVSPIRSESFSMLVPADVRGPITNNTCRAWGNHAESCYLVARRTNAPAADAAAGLDGVLERHLSGVVGAWKAGAWPADGDSVNLAVEQYASFEQLWLTYRIEMREQITACWITGRDDPLRQIKYASSRPAEFHLEMFAGTRSAQGYPRKVQF